MTSERGFSREKPSSKPSTPNSEREELHAVKAACNAWDAGRDARRVVQWEEAGKEGGGASARRADGRSAKVERQDGRRTDGWSCSEGVGERAEGESGREGERILGTLLRWVNVGQRLVLLAILLLVVNH